ncbi:MAG: Peptide chain release factor 2 [Chlamydiales bacterium]|nr:Peptide chain release factor 2 [Chlamydiales bacterium]MCH9619348.1 Peptide chain release factor 2 [Chlamydiales bacterium]MCH9622152.1 Peptide chain release factor 2 [Chlamydiales bacterium]
MEEPSFWDDNTSAQKVIAENNGLKVWTGPYAELKKRFEDVKELLPVAEEEGDEALISEMEAELKAVDKEICELETRRMLSGELDASNCYLSINAGAGGTEACDWALMLSRMYQRWAERKNFKIHVVDSVEGDVAGVKSITLKLDGPFAYGYGKAEKGVHRLVRISPFDSGARRHTSFASVDVLPEISDEIEIDINPADIRVDTFRSSGAGGQHVNTTDSAVRMTHQPSGIVVSCQQERSQIKNRETCMKMLRSKLYEKQVEERQESLKEIGGEKKKIEWGSQIRNYVFQPYTLVKDARTGYETGNINAMMDGEVLDEFIVAFLKELGNG